MLEAGVKAPEFSLQDKDGNIVSLKDFIRQYQQEQMNKMRNRDTAKRTSQRTDNEIHQPSLFDTL